MRVGLAVPPASIPCVHPCGRMRSSTYSTGLTRAVACWHARVATRGPAPPQKKAYIWLLNTRCGARVLCCRTRAGQGAVGGGNFSSLHHGRGGWCEAASWGVCAPSVGRPVARGAPQRLLHMTEDSISRLGHFFLNTTHRPYTRYPKTEWRSVPGQCAPVVCLCLELMLRVFLPQFVSRMVVDIESWECR